MRRNKTHKRKGGTRRSLCGVDRGANHKHKVPTAIDWRDVDCKLCLRMRKHKP